MGDIMATTARGRLRLLLMPSPAMDTTVMDTAMDMVTVMAMEAMDITATAMVRGRLRLLLLLSLAMDTMAMDMVMAMDTDTAMVAMDITATAMARGLLMLRLSPDMDTTAMDTDMDMATVTDMAMAMATTDKFLLLFSAVESSVQTKNLDHLVLVLNFKILNKLFDKEM